MRSHRMMNRILFCLALLSSALAFVPSTVGPATRHVARSSSVTPLKATSIPTEIFTNTAATESSSSIVSVATLDPTTILSDTLGGLLGSSAILLVPVIAALSIAGLIAFLIVSYANPADEDD